MIKPNEPKAVRDISSELQSILERHGDMILGYLARKLPKDVNDFIDPQDILQDTFFEAFQRMGEFTTLSDAATSQWLLTIARHRLINLVRAKRRLKRAGGRQRIQDDSDVICVLEELALYTRTPSQSAMRHEIAALVQRSINVIQSPLREAIQLRYLDGLSSKESAMRMGRSEKAFFMLCKRGRDALREKLQSVVFAY